LEEFLAQAYNHQLYFNYTCQNSYEGNRLPLDIVRETGDLNPHILPRQPVLLDPLSNQFELPLSIKNGYLARSMYVKGCIHKIGTRFTLGKVHFLGYSRLPSLLLSAALVGLGRAV